MNISGIVKPIINTAHKKQNIAGEIFNKSISQIADSKAILPVLMLEGTVIAGRCHQAKKRNEFEFWERLREELLTSAVWLFGVDAFNKTFDFGIKKLLKLDTSADIFSEDVLKRITEGRSERFKTSLTAAKFTKVAVSTAATIYLIGSAIPKLNQALTRKAIKEQMAEEKQNNSKSDNNIKNVASAELTNQVSNSDLNRLVANFSKSYNGLNQPLNKNIANKVSFSGGPALINFVRSAGYNMESNAWFKLWTGDVGVSGGRALHARNKDERVEILFRDVGSIFFYMFSTSLTIKALSKMFDGKLGIHSDINPSLIGHFNDSILQKAGDLRGKTFSEAKDLIKGVDLTKTVSKSVESTLQNNDKNIINVAMNKIKQLKAQLAFSDQIRMLANEFKEAGFENHSIIFELEEQADNLFQQSRLGQLLSSNVNSDLEKTEKTVGKGIGKILSSRQKSAPKLAKADFEALKDNTIKAINELIEKESDGEIRNKLSDVLAKIQNKLFSSKELFEKQVLSKAELTAAQRGGIINTPEFIGKAAKIGFGPTWFDKLPDFLNPKRHVDMDDVEGIRANLEKYADKFLEHLKNEAGDNKKIDDNTLNKVLNKVKNKTVASRLIYCICGLGTSALFLSYLIPKWQQKLTEMRTGSTEFPGIKDLQA